MLRSEAYSEVTVTALSTISTLTPSKARGLKTVARSMSMAMTSSLGRMRRSAMALMGSMLCG